MKRDRRLDAIYDCLGPRELARAATDADRQLLESIVAGGNDNDPSARPISRRASSFTREQHDQYLALLRQVTRARVQAATITPALPVLAAWSNTATLGARGWRLLQRIADGMLPILDSARAAVTEVEQSSLEEPSVGAQLTEIGFDPTTMVAGIDDFMETMKLIQSEAARALESLTETDREATEQAITLASRVGATVDAAQTALGGSIEVLPEPLRSLLAAGRKVSGGEASLESTFGEQ